MASSALLLIADSDCSRRDLLAKHYHALGLRTNLIGHGAIIKEVALDPPPDLAIFDDSPSLVAASDICRRLRDAGSTTPLIVLCSGGHYSHRVAVLNAGADVALSSPFALEELDAIINALLRRHQILSVDNDASCLAHRDLRIELNARVVSRAGHVIRLTVKEYELLLFLLRHKEQVLSRHHILKSVWGETWVGDDNLLDVYIRYLRRKVELADHDPLIHTVRGVGFTLR